MARNDHWFKFYYHRILVSCFGWKDDEIGAYIKLLIHQFDKGFIPKEEKELKRIITSYNKNWPLLSAKFKEVEPGKLINDVMDEVRTERNERAKKDKKNGSKGGRPKKPSGLIVGSENERHIYSNSISNSQKKDDGMEEEKNDAFIVPGMITMWKENNPKAFIRIDDDFPIMLDIAKSLKEWMELDGDLVLDENAEKIKHRWGEIVEFLCEDSFLKNYSLVQISKHLASVIQSFNNRENGSKKSNSNGSATSRSVASLLSGSDAGFTDSEDMDR